MPSSGRFAARQSWPLPSPKDFWAVPAWPHPLHRCFPATSFTALQPAVAPAPAFTSAGDFHALPTVIKPQKQLFNCFSQMLARCSQCWEAGCFFFFSSSSFRIALCQWLILGFEIKWVVYGLQVRWNRGADSASLKAAVETGSQQPKSSTLP